MTSITYHCAKEGMVPLARYAAEYARRYVLGKYYTLQEVTERSRESHNLYFKCVEVAWLNLPHGIAERFSTDARLGPDQFRKWCLIMVGLHDQTVEPFDTEEDARRMATILATQIAKQEGFVVVSIDEATRRVVTILVARTQKQKKNDPNGMDKKDFEASKTAVLEYACSWIRMGVEELVAEAKKQMVRQKRVA
jgi:hypothetical protein